MPAASGSAATPTQRERATFQFIEPQRPWASSLGLPEHDPSVPRQARPSGTRRATSRRTPRHCRPASRHRRDARTPQAQGERVGLAGGLRGARSGNKKKREKRKQQHEAERTRMAVVCNCFAHLGHSARGHELLRRGGAHRFDGARAAASSRSPTSSRGGASTRHGPHAAHVGGPGAGRLGIELRSFYRTRRRPRRTGAPRALRGETRRQGEAASRRAEVQGGGQEGVRQARG